MGMSIEVIFNKLKNKKSELYVNDHEHTLINHVRLCKQNQSYFRSDILYIINDSTLSKLSLELKCANILCAGKCNNTLKISNSLNINMLFMNDNTDSEVIADRIETILDKQQTLLQYTNILFELLSQGKGLQQIINKGYEMLGNMVLLSDVSMNVTLHSENAKSDDSLKKWIYEDRTENYNTFYIKHREKRGFEKSFKSRYPMYIGKDMDTYAYLASDVIVDNNVIAHIIVIEYEKPFKEEDYEIISLLCKIVSLELQKDRFICNTRGFLYEYLFIDLLEGRIKDPLIIEDRIKSLNIELKENLYVFAIVVKKDEQSNTKLSYIRNLLEDMIKNSKSVIYNDNIMLLINTSGDEEPFHKVDLETLKNFLKNNKMQGGLSYCFHDLKDLKDYYKQSLTSIEMGIHLNTEETIFSYEDYAIYHILHICAKDGNLKCFCHPSLITLIEYDKRYNTSFTYTLYVYLNYERNQTETAKALHIHRSTLLYRIKKAEEIMNLSLKSNNLVFKHYVSFKILEFMGEFSGLLF